jgi:glycosyltransferase involved in cell wall biosynthesis
MSAGTAAAESAAQSDAPFAVRFAGARERISLSDFGIVYFGNDWFAENRTSSHHVAARLARRTRVLYVDSPGLRAPKATGRDFRKLQRKLLMVASKPRQVADQMWHITMPQVPFRRLPAIADINRVTGRFLVRRAMKQLGFERTISWFAVPHPGILARTLDETLTVYYCIDDYAALPDVDAAAVTGMDTHLLRSADQVFVASGLLLESKRQMNASAVHAPHGVDVELFRDACDPRLPVADAAKDLPRPVIGFYGLIESWIDLDLVAFLATQRPQWTFLMIGRLAVDPGPLRDLPNVVFAGPQPYESLPRWAKAFDVAIIPYRLTRQVVNSNPLKLREYLATGKPVVAVSAPEIDRFSAHVRIAANSQQFLDHIEAALATDTPAQQQARMQSVADMSWDARIDEVVRIVEERLTERSIRR